MSLFLYVKYNKATKKKKRKNNINKGLWFILLSKALILKLFIIINMRSFVFQLCLNLYINGNNKVALGLIMTLLILRIIHAPKSQVSFPIFSSQTQNALLSTLAKMADQWALSRGVVSQTFCRKREALLQFLVIISMSLFRQDYARLWQQVSWKC